MITNEDLLQKATFTTPDLLGGVTTDSADRFINLMTAQQDMMNDVRVVRSNAAKWQEAFIDFANRIARPGVEAQRIAEPDRVKPSVAFVEMSTVLIKGEVPVSDEALEDAMGGQANFETTLTEGIANRFGYDVEDLLLNGDTASADPYLSLTDGWLKLARSAGGNQVDASGATSYTDIFAALLAALPDRYKRNLQQDGRFYVSHTIEQGYRTELQQRGTALGDSAITENNELRFQGIGLRPVANWPSNGSTTQILFTNRNNLYAGFRREIQLETFRDPRDGATSFIVTSRVDSQIGVREATAVATNVPANL